MPGLTAKEWPLICFTLLAQTAVGAFWMIAAATLLWERPNSGIGSRYMTFPALASVLLVCGAAAALSFFHLGKPGRAVFVLNNLRTSWLSREIFFELLFLFFAALLALLTWKKMPSTALIRGLVAGASIAAFLFLYSMSRLYMLSTVPVWRSLYTPLSFFLTAFLLGPLAAAAAHGRFVKEAWKADAFQHAAVFMALAAIVLIMLTILLLTPNIGLFGVKKATLLEFPAARMYPLLFLRVLLLAAVVCLFLFFYRGRAGDRLLAIAFFCAGAAEAVGRYLFYAIYSRLGV